MLQAFLYSELNWQTDPFGIYCIYGLKAGGNRQTGMQVGRQAVRQTEENQTGRRQAASQKYDYWNLWNSAQHVLVRFSVLNIITIRFSWNYRWLESRRQTGIQAGSQSGRRKSDRQAGRQKEFRQTGRQAEGNQTGRQADMHDIGRRAGKIMPLLSCQHNSASYCSWFCSS